MNVEHFGGSVECTDGLLLDGILDVRFGDEANEYLLSHEERYPLLTIQVRGDIACLHFFLGEDHAGFISVGDRKRRDLVTLNTNTPSETIEIAGSFVVTLHRARAAAHEFLRSASRPTSIDWEEL